MRDSLGKIFLFTVSFVSYIATAGQVFAKEDEIGTVVRPTILPPINAGEFLSGLIGLIIIVAFLASFIFLIWGGFQWITSGGDEAGITAARGRIIQALIGLTVVVAAWAIFQLVQSAFGITVLGGDLGQLFRNLFFPGGTAGGGGSDIAEICSKACHKADSCLINISNCIPRCTENTEFQNYAKCVAANVKLDCPVIPTACPIPIQ